MRRSVVAALGALAAVAVSSARAQAPAPPAIVADLLRDVQQVEEKLVGLARAVPNERYAWRPAEGVRSVGEVFQHVAADNYLLPGFLGTAPPAATGIKADDYGTVQAYERRSIPRDTAIADLQRSFAHLRAALGATTATRLGETATFFGQQMTVQQVWVLAVTHLHEHLGQTIAYARANGVVPPWSR
jgi:uncharacterized damage-inducible protein DinB